MKTDRRNFLVASAVLGAVGFLPARLAAQPPGLESLTAGLSPISAQEHLARIVRLQDLMRRGGLHAIIIEPGASLTYFTGVRWGRSERLTAVVIPADGAPAIVTPYFEEPSVRESLRIEAEVRPWHEHEDPLVKVAGILKDRKVKGPVGLEETVRYFVPDGLKRAMPAVEIRSGANAVRACRMIKSPAELRLMQAASDVTMAAYRYTAPRIEKGMRPSDIGRIMSQATTALGGRSEFELILLGEASAYPHGSGKPQEVREGEVVLMDCGCTVHGYQSDISRTFVFGDPTREQRKVWNDMRNGQQIAFEAAQVGRPAGSVDDAVRAYYTSLAYGPDYRLPGLSHRTGHGIGMDGHEPVNFVHGEATPLAPGMCLSNEPGIYLPGKFGIRLEDCLYMTDAGPRWFSTPPASIDTVFA